MKIIDFKKKGNLVRFYLGEDSNEDYEGDDWNDVPYECNAGKVYQESKDPEWQNSSRWCKNDMKARKVPCIIAVPKPDGWYDDDFDRYVGDKQAIKFYFGDKMEPAGSLTAFEVEN